MRNDAWLFTVFRVVFGTYLCVHFAHLLPWAAELFSNEGVVRDAALNASPGPFGPAFDLLGSPVSATALVAVLLGLSMALTLGVWRRAVGPMLWFGWAYLLARNNLIANPGIPYVGLLLLLMALVPTGEPLALTARRNPAWKMPREVLIVAWIALAAGYSFSGYTKLISPHWADGSALMLMLDNPLARGSVGGLAASIPEWVLRCAAWSVVGAELLFLPGCAHRVTRKLAWAGMTVMHVSVLATVGFADLTFGMLVVHLFVFDLKWIPSFRRKENWNYHPPHESLGHAPRTIRVSRVSASSTRGV
jgi:hypothetical protein